MKPCAQSCSPSSAVTTGTCAVTGCTVLAQQPAVTQPLLSYSWKDAISAFAGSTGRNCNQPLSSLPQRTRAGSGGWVAPPPRTAFTSDCIPAVCQPPAVRQPSRQQSQLMSCGVL